MTEESAARRDTSVEERPMNHSDATLVCSELLEEPLELAVRGEVHHNPAPAPPTHDLDPGAECDA